MNKAMSKSKVLAAAGIVTALGLGIGTASAEITEAQVTAGEAKSPGFTIDASHVIANGSGCPQGSVQTLISPDQTALTVAFSDYTAAAGPNTRPTERRRACTTTIPVRIPNGYTWGITTASYRGYAELYDGAKAYQGATYFFQGGRSGALESELSPDGSGNWEVSDNAATVAWAPCDTQSNLVVTSSLRITPGSDAKQTSFVSMDTQDIAMRSSNVPAMTFGLDFKPCN